jgi:NAD(P)-dependent dehydrogenase (short-subunit alcohol dehydrogenase family)
MATAAEFATRGALVALVARSRDGLDKAAAAVEVNGGTPLIAEADVTDRAALAAAFDRALEEFGGLDVVVVNAGGAAYGRFAHTSAEDFDLALAVTLRGAVDTIRLALSPLEESEGSLVVVGSVADTIPLPLMSGYTAAKHGLRGFVDALKVELRSEGSPISLSLVSPGPVDTPFWDNVAAQEGRLPPKLPASYMPEDVAMTIVRCAEKRRAGATVGGLMVTVRTAHSLLSPISERLLAVAMRWARRAGREGGGGRAIDRPAGSGEQDGGAGGRPSLVVRGLGAATGAAARVVRR